MKDFQKKTLLLHVNKCYCVLFTARSYFGPHEADGMKFTTHDRKQDTNLLYNCAQNYHGAWWYKNCGHENPNGRYLTPGTHSSASMSYVAFLGDWISLKTMKIMFR